MSERTKSPLTSRQRHELWGYVDKEYAKSGLGDAEFTKQAIQVLGIECIKAHHVHACRTALEIPANRPVKAPVTLEARLDAIERHLEALWGQLGWYPPGERA